MNEALQKKVVWFHNLNKTAKRGSIVFAGSTFMYNFPIYELEHNFSMTEQVYNRSVENLCIADFPYLLATCVFELLPSKLFISIGEADVDKGIYDKKTFPDEYTQVLLSIRQHIPTCKLYSIGLMPTVCGYEKINSTIRSCVNNLDCEFLDFANILVDSRDHIKPDYSKDKKTLLPQAYIAILRNLKISFRSRMMRFGEVWNMVENWG